ncbi:hypothetical protein ACWEQL_40025 [Kitasatospora sp. NPDC004240]
MFAWDLDRSVEPDSVAQVLVGLLDVPGLRMVIEGSAEQFETAHASAILSLDDPRWTDAARFAAWYERRRGASPFTATDVYPSPGAALLASKVPEAAAPGAAHQVEASWWAAVPAEVRPAFAALAGAVQPLTLVQWSAVAGDATAAEAARLLPPDRAGSSTWWLAPGRLRETVTADVAPLEAGALARALATAVPRLPGGSPDFGHADPGLLGVVLLHAVEGGFADQVLDDFVMLVQADPVAATAVLAAHPERRSAAVWRAAGPALIDESDSGVRAAVLGARLSREAHERAPVTPAGACGWTVDQAYWLPSGHAPIVSGALTRGPDAGYVVLVTEEGSLHAVELSTGRQAPVPAGAPPGAVRSLQALADGSLIALGADGRPHVLVGSPHQQISPPREGGRMTALGPLGSTGDSDGQVHWAGGGVSAVLHDGPVTALAAAVTHGPTGVVVVSGGVDGCVRSWVPATGEQEEVDRRPLPVTSVAAEQGADGPVLAASWSDGLARIHRPQDARTLDIRLGSPVCSVLVDSEGRILLVLPEGVVRILPGAAILEGHEPSGPGSRDAAGPRPRDAEDALVRLASGEGSPTELLTALLDAELLVCPDAVTGDLLVTAGSNGSRGVDACTSSEHVPRHWAEPVLMAGRDLAVAHPAVDLRLNPASPLSLTFPLRDLAQAAGAG